MMKFVPGQLVLAMMLPLLACSRGENAEATPIFGDLSFSSVGEAPTTNLVFTDVTLAAGIDFVHENGARGAKWMPETVGGGGGFLDYDNDGKPDIFLVNSGLWPDDPDPSQHNSRLYRNLGDGRFEDVTSQTGLAVAVYGMGAAFADYDGDGDTDIYITAVGDNLLLRNDNGHFTDVTALAGVSGNSQEPGQDPSWSTGAAWFDFDRDGWVDLFVCNYVRWTPATDLYTTLDGVSKSYATPDVYEGDSCRLYRNTNGERFEDVSSTAGVLNPLGKSLGIAVTDINDDGWPDIVVSNDTEANYLYVNRGDGTFEDVALGAGVGYDEFGRARAGMGIDVAHIGEGKNLTIAIGNFSREPVSLYTQSTPGLFSDRAGALGIATSTLMPLTFGIRFDDFNRDGNVDLFLANGHIEPDINSIQENIHFAQVPQLFLGTDGGRFFEMGTTAGPVFAEPMVGRGVATADYDGDGDLDVLIMANGERPRLLRNDLPHNENNWIRLHLVGNPPNTAALGASITVFAADRIQRRYLRTSSSYLSQSYVSEVLVGIGDAGFVDSITIRWPTTGDISRLGRLDANTDLIIRESDEVRANTAND